MSRHHTNRIQQLEAGSKNFHYRGQGGLMNHVPGNDAIVGGPRGCIITEDQDTFMAE